MDKYRLINEKIGAGYKLLKGKQTGEACDVMLDAWEDIKAVMVEDKVHSLPSTTTAGTR